MIDTGCHPKAWFRAACHVADVHNHTASPKNNFRTPIEVSDGETPDITGLCEFTFWQKVLYADPAASFPQQGGNEKPGRWMGRATNYGDTMCYWILTEDTNELIVRSMVHDAENHVQPNRGVTFESDNKGSDWGEFPIITYKEIIQQEDGIASSKKNCEKPGQPRVLIHTPKLINPDDLIDVYVKTTRMNRRGKIAEIKGQIKERIDEENYRVELANGNQ